MMMMMMMMMMMVAAVLLKMSSRDWIFTAGTCACWRVNMKVLILSHAQARGAWKCHKGGT